MEHLFTIEKILKNNYNGVPNILYLSHENVIEPTEEMLGDNLKCLYRKQSK